MSLINDALKRAKAAQAATPPPLSLPHLRPAEPDHARVRHGIGFTLPIAFAAVALLVLFFAWRLARQEESASQKAPPPVDRTEAPSASAAPVTQEPAHSSPTTVRARTQPTPSLAGSNGPSATSSAVNRETSPAPVATPTSTGTPAVVPTPSGASTTADALSIVSPTNNLVLPVQPPKPAPLKLQSVVYNPRRPSAVINGKVLFVGERFGSMRVSAIRPDSVVLVGGGQTNIVTLDE